MQDTLSVRVVQRVRHLAQQVADAFVGQLVGHQALQGSPVHVLHDDVGQLALAPKVVDRQDIGMAQLRDRLRLALEAGQESLVAHVVLRQDLDGYHPLQAGLEGLEHLGHPTFAQCFDDPVPAQRLADELIHDCLSSRPQGFQANRRFAHP